MTNYSPLASDPAEFDLVAQRLDQLLDLSTKIEDARIAVEALTSNATRAAETTEKVLSAQETLEGIPVDQILAQDRQDLAKIIADLGDQLDKALRTQVQAIFQVQGSLTTAADTLRQRYFGLPQPVEARALRHMGAVLEKEIGTYTSQERDTKRALELWRAVSQACSGQEALKDIAAHADAEIKRLERSAKLRLVFRYGGGVIFLVAVLAGIVLLLEQCGPLPILTTPTPTWTATLTPTPTLTPTQMATSTPTVMPTPTVTVTPSVTPTPTTPPVVSLPPEDCTIALVGVNDMITLQATVTGTVTIGQERIVAWGGVKPRPGDCDIRELKNRRFRLALVAGAGTLTPVSAPPLQPQSEDMALDVTKWADKLEIPFVIAQKSPGTFTGSAVYVLQYKVEKPNGQLDWLGIGVLRLELKWDITVVAPTPTPTRTPIPAATAALSAKAPKPTCIPVGTITVIDPPKEANPKATFKWTYNGTVSSEAGYGFRIVFWAPDPDSSCSENSPCVQELTGQGAVTREGETSYLAKDLQLPPTLKNGQYNWYVEFRIPNLCPPGYLNSDRHTIKLIQSNGTTSGEGKP